ncbi:transketolase [Candidatus Nomurabacteria bacterium RIFCSPHIGHO2_01_FULL_38_19]|uniref:Transketolase n=1 Tax=Candidatus Nomurabacteria bacterium RIFCSPHIGHO2_01_FULL_38_19 TaxID=1801732 RepID=A0A1F6UQ74_9BACT|nr:MAG: transketolase [Candidatus Nomurabacteria bacterium RIFCSPHIGHO2_01_FULL_38_19]
MLNPKLKLNSKLFNEDVEQTPIRKGFGQGLVQAGDADANVVALCADLTESTQMILFKEKFPERFVEVGVAEQNLVTVASGMAAMGKIPFCSSYAMFSPGRNWEQIRTTIAYNDRAVKIIGSHAGVSVGADGGTHQALEDIALMRVIPNMDVVSPCDSVEAKKATLILAKTSRPGYLRLAREKTPVITTEETPFNIGKAEIYWMPDMGLAQVGIIVTGGLMHRTLLVAKELENPLSAHSGGGGEGIKTKVMNLSSIKPIDKDAIIVLARECKAIVTVEEHQVAGGMGSAVAEVLAQNFPVPMEFIGVQDKFGQSGTPDELVEHYGMGKNSIKEAVKRVLERKI